MSGERDLVPFHLWAESESATFERHAATLKKYINVRMDRENVMDTGALIHFELVKSYSVLLKVLASDAADKLANSIPAPTELPHLKMFIFQHNGDHPWQGFAFGVTEEQARKDGSIFPEAVCIGWH